LIDLRSDFCAPPTDEMWEAMRSAPFGWAAAGEDETVNELERRSAALLGKDAAVFVATCSQANLAAVLALSEPGERVAIAADTHIVVNEGGWLTELAGLVPVPLGEAAPLLCLENTRTRAGGAVLTLAKAAELAAAATRVHLDGARLANAAVALGVPLADLAAPPTRSRSASTRASARRWARSLPVRSCDRSRPRPSRCRRDDPQGRDPRRGGSRRARAADRLADDHRRAQPAASSTCPSPRRTSWTGLEAGSLPPCRVGRPSRSRGRFTRAPDSPRMTTANRGGRGGDPQPLSRAVSPGDGE
jgi:hypothetical protein